jgi:hypothetical protein
MLIGDRSVNIELRTVWAWGTDDPTLWSKPISQTWMNTFPRNPRLHRSRYSLCEL